MLPTISQFCGPNTTKIEIGALALYFSYQQCIAFKVGNQLTICENETWNNTTSNFYFN